MFVKVGIRAKIILLTIAILTLSIGINSYITNSVFIKAYSRAFILQSQSTANSLKLQIEKILTLGIELEEIVGFNKQCKDAVNENDIITYSTVTNTFGNVIFHSDPKFINNIIQIPNILLDEKNTEKNVTIVEYNGQEVYEISIPFYGRYEYIEGWIKVGFPITTIVLKTREMWSIATIISTGSITFAIIILLFSLSKFVTGPLSKLILNIAEVRQFGPYSVTFVENKSQDEIGKLSRAFSDLMEEVKKSNTEIQEYAQMLEEKVGERTAELEETNQQLMEEIDERKKIETQISTSLKEKEVLLKEIHHRVKNNLQVISSLLNLQSRLIPDETSKAMFTESMNRVKAMALIHERLYQSKDITNIDFNEYVRALVSELYASYMISTNKIKTKILIEDVDFTIDTAIPCGLIINELFSNSLKYAFPNDKNGTISIKLLKKADFNYELIIGDDGIGLPKKVDIRKSGSLGLRLVFGLAEEQLAGDLKINQENGTEFVINFQALK